jgi:hypothetical protein
VHQTHVDHYVKANRDFWRVVCTGCGIAVEDLGAFAAGEVADVLARRMCGFAIASAPQTRPAMSDEQIVATWTGRDLSDERVAADESPLSQAS